MAGDSRTLTLKILGDASGAQKAFGQLEKDSDGLGSKLAGVGAAIGKVFIGAGVAAGAFGVKAVLSASDLAETMSKVGVVFGDQQQIVTNFANQMAKDFGAPKREILDAAASIGLIGKASGLSQGDAAKMSTQLGKLAADASSFYNVPLPEALQAIQSGLVGEAEPMRRFGVLLNAQAVDAEAARLGLQKVGKEYTEGAKAQARASLIMSGMKDASGDLERTQGSLANRLKELKGRAANFAADFGTKLLPVVLAGMDLFERLSGVVGSKVGPVFKQVGVAVRAMVSAFQEGDVTSNGLVGAFERIGNAARTLFLGVRALYLAFKDGDVTSNGFVGAMERIGVVLRAIFDFIKTNIVPVLAALGAVIASVVIPAFVSWATAAYAAAAAQIALAAPAIALGVAVAALAAGVVYAYQHFEGFRDAIDKVAAFITGTVMPAIAKFASYLIEQLGAAVEWVRRIWPQVSEAIGHVMNVVAGIIRSTIDAVSAIWRAWGDDLLRIVRTAFDFIRGTIDNVLQVIRGVIQTVLAIINGDWGRAWDGIKQVLAGIWDQLVNVVRTALGTLGSVIGGALSTIAEVWRGIWDSIKNDLPAKLGSIISTVRTEIGKIPGVMVEAIGDLAGILYEAGRDLIKGLIRGILSMAGAVKGAVGGAVKEAVDDIPLLGRVTKGARGDGEGLENTGAIGKGYQSAIASLKSSGIPYGVSSTLRPFATTSSGNLSLHALGKAVDFTGPNKGAIANWFLQQASSLRELIYTPLGFSIKNGQRVAPIAASDHYDHVHVGTYDQGGILPPGLTLAMNKTGHNEYISTTKPAAGPPVVNVYVDLDVHGSVMTAQDLTTTVITGITEHVRRNGSPGWG